MSYAGFWKRFVAALIDIFVCITVYLVIGLVLKMVMFPTGIHDLTVAQRAHTYEIATQLGKILGVISVIFYALYFAGMESSSIQGTIGKMVLGIKVTDLKGNRIDFDKAINRTLFKGFSLIFFIGFIMVAFTQKKQGLHDIIAGCLVLNITA